MLSFENLVFLSCELAVANLLIISLLIFVLISTRARKSTGTVITTPHTFLLKKSKNSDNSEEE